MRLDLQEILLKRWRNSELAHFYIIETGSFPEAARLLNEKIQSIMETILQEDLKSRGFGIPKNVWDHPDFLQIFPEEEKKDYVIEDFIDKGFFNFLELRPYQLKWRFICIQDAHKVSKNLSNKLLKTLEEPPERTTIFFLNPHAKPLLSTIQSRAITLRLSLETSQRQEYFGTQLAQIIEKNTSHLINEDEIELRNLLQIFVQENKGLGDLIEKIKSADRDFQRQAYELFLDLERSYMGSFEHKQKALQALEWFQTSQTFNNPSAERFFILFNGLQNP